MAALSLRHSQTGPGAYYRQIARRLGGDVAVLPMKKQYQERRIGTLKKHRSRTRL
jgi:hypothetical protein